MNLPEQPPTFRPPLARRAARGGGGWRTPRAPRSRSPEELADQRFASQADAESWVGEIWSELAAEGVDAVMLFEHDRQVYGPMSLHA